MLFNGKVEGFLGMSLLMQLLISLKKPQILSNLTTSLQLRTSMPAQDQFLYWKGTSPSMQS